MIWQRRLKMSANRREMKRLGLWCLLIATCVLGASATSYAQTTSPTTAELSHARPVQDSETLKALEIANIRLKAANETIALLNDRLAAKDEIITAKDGTIAVRNEQLELAKSAGKDRAGANTIDQFRAESCNAQLSKADAEIHRLRNPPFFKRLFSTDTVTGFAIGYGVKSIQK